jgi:hypothetical protein
MSSDLQFFPSTSCLLLRYSFRLSRYHVTLPDSVVAAAASTHVPRINSMLSIVTMATGIIFHVAGGYAVVTRLG